MRRAAIEPTGFLDSMTSSAAQGTADAVLVIPVGATEQHGPHLPLTTDTDIAVALAERLAGRCHDVVIAPALSYGASDEHRGFAGTLSIGKDAVELVLTELVRSASRTWHRILVISTHGGNDASVRRAVQRLRAEGRDIWAWLPSWPGDAHAGHTETSIMLCVDPERVDRAAAEAGAREPLDELMGTMRTGGVAAVSANGVLGDPTTADPDHGRHLLESATEELMALVADWPAGAP